MSTKAIAETAQAVKEKYGKKRFTSFTAGKSLIYSHIYRGYQADEGVPANEAQGLYADLEAIKAKVNNNDDASRYNVYVRLIEWLISAFEAAIIMRNAVKSVAVHYYDTVTGIIAAENLRKTLGDQANQSAIWLWLHVLTIDKYNPQDDGYYSVEAMRNNIASGLCYLNAYHILIELIAAEIDIPEFTFYKVDMDTVEYIIAALNKALTTLREQIETHKGILEKDSYIIGGYTPEYLKETMKVFQPVDAEAEALPEEKLNTTKRNLHAFFVQGYSSWPNLFTLMTDNYWRR